ncbi:MAG TPA: HAD-IIA family hydrolase [Mycobacteriales bacterium]|nr:HAD-IIA family hydrolase [Mycobacteriales bacterium]
MIVGLVGCEVPPVTRYDVALLDLDGVVYLGAEGIPGAAEALEKALEAGMRRAFVTNNASRTPDEVADLLRSVGVPATATEVVTSAQAAAHLLADRLPAGARVLVLGTEALVSEVRARGLTPVASAEEAPAAVVQGYSPNLGWRHLAEAAIAVQRGALWVATNLDRSVPSVRGPLPGNGALVGAVRAAVEVDPLVTGKPEPALHRESVERTGARHPLIVGDRLDTDIEGASRAGVDSLLVLTGVTTPAMLLAAPRHHRPTYLAANLEGLLHPHPALEIRPDGVWCGDFGATRQDGVLRLRGAGTDRLEALRALCGAAWVEPGPALPGGPRHVTADGEQAAAALRGLGLA